jgi:MFS family permease
MSAAPVAAAAAPGVRSWRTPALIIVCGCILSFIAFGVRSGSGLFLTPISQEYGWGREIFALSIALQMLIWGACVPIAGAVADKYGSGRVLATGALFYAGGFALMAYSSAPWHMHLTAGALVGIGLAGTSFTIVMAVLARLVRPERRTMVVGLCSAFTSLGQFVILPLGQGFITAYGWHTAALLLGAIALAMLPFSFVVRSNGRPPAGVVDQKLTAALSEAFGYRSYVLTVIGFFVCGFQLFFILNHLPSYLSDQGIPPWVASWTLALVGLANVAGAILAGVVGARWPGHKRLWLAFIYVARSVATAAFILLPLAPANALVYGAIIGLLWLSTVPLTQGLVAQFFGLRWLATLFGIAFFSHQVGGFLGVWLGGLLFDLYKSYDIVWWLNIAMGLFAAAVHIPIREAPAPRLAAAAAAGAR